ncbi:MAG: hypothetical protein RI883_41 [Bacteroidota bacterium]|jgi:hypothetical protein
MNKIISFLPLFSILLILGATSCKKKCVIEKGDVDGGSIVQDVIFYPSSGYMTGNMGGNYVINASHPYSNKIQVKFSEGEKIPVNYSNYTVLCYPTTAKCNAAYERTVTIDNTLGTVVYKIVVTQCANCEEKRTTENYVLVPAFPSSYFVYYDVSYVEK